MSSNSVLVIAGESSGDALCARTIEHWKKINPQLSFWGFGGSRMQAQGVEILHDIEELSVIGVSEALLHYRRLLGYAKELLYEMERRQTQFVLLVDYPGFNLRLAKKLKLHKKFSSVQCHLLVSPQLWAWRYHRIYEIKKYISSVLCLFAFETEMYLKENIETVFVGHPLAENAQRLQKFFFSRGNPLQKKLSSPREHTILLLPGSRRNEILRHIDFLLQVAFRLQEKNPQLRFVIPAAGEKANQILSTIQLPPYITLLPPQENQSQAAMNYCHAALACSGTATLECALFSIPFALIYNTSWLTFWVGKRVVKLPYIGMVNVLAKKFVTQEFIQADMKEEPVTQEMERLIFDADYRKNMLGDFKEVAKQLESKNSPAQEAALWLQKKFHWHLTCDKRK